MTKTKNPRSRNGLFKVLSEERETPTGRACIAIAKELFGPDGQSLTEMSSREARGWMKLAMEADRQAREKTLKELEAIKDALLEGKERDDNLGQLTRQADNVVPLAKKG